MSCDRLTTGTTAENPQKSKSCFTAAVLIITLADKACCSTETYISCVGRWCKRTYNILQRNSHVYSPPRLLSSVVGPFLSRATHLG